MKKLTKILSPFVIVGSSAVQALAVEAVLPENPVQSGDLVSWIKTVLNVVIGLAALVSVVMLIAAGYSYITAAGDEGKVEKATKTLTFAVVGLVICFISVIVVQFVLGKIIVSN